MSIWTKHKFQKDCYCRLSVGPLNVWIKKEADEIKVASDRNAYSNPSNNNQSQIEWIKPEQAPKDNDLDWTRWVVGNSVDAITILPAMPDRAIIVRPERPLKILPGQKAIFYVRIPIFVQIIAGDSANNNVLCEIPTIEMSNIWLGDPTAGELCYSLRSTARRAYSDMQPLEHRVICPVAIRNKGKTQIDIVRFCVQSNHLSIYKGSSHICTNQVMVDFQGESSDTSASYSDKPADIESDASVLTAARVPVRKTLLKRGIDSFKIFG